MQVTGDIYFSDCSEIPPAIGGDGAHETMAAFMMTAFQASTPLHYLPSPSVLTAVHCLTLQLVILHHICATSANVLSASAHQLYRVHQLCRAIITDLHPYIFDLFEPCRSMPPLSQPLKQSNVLTHSSKGHVCYACCQSKQHQAPIVGGSVLSRSCTACSDGALATGHFSSARLCDGAGEALRKDPQVLTIAGHHHCYS